MAIDVQKTTREQLEELFRETQKELAKRDKEERDSALREARALVGRFSFTQDEIFGGSKARGKLYRNPTDPYGKKWSGRGRVPKEIERWLKENPDKTIEDLLV